MTPMACPPTNLIPARINLTRLHHAWSCTPAYLLRPSR